MAFVPINNALADPLQSQDVDAFLLDQGTGELALIGRFVSFMASVRNATRPYNPLNSRIPRLLDGTLTFEWTLQRGMVDTRVVERTFGYSLNEDGSRARMTRSDRISRHPRFSLVIEMNPEELEGDLEGRLAKGRYMLTYCKTEVLSFGADGSNNGIVPVQWEGMAEGIYFEDKTSEFSSSTSGGEAVQENAVVGEEGSAQIPDELG
jgi:hypothetical protein